MNSGARSFYFKLFVAGLMVLAPAGAFSVYTNYQRLEGLLDQQLIESFKSVGSQILDPLANPVDLHSRFATVAEQTLDRQSDASPSIEFVQAALYRRGDRTGDWQMAFSVQMDKLSALPFLPANSFREQEFHSLRRLDQRRFTYIFPATPKSPEYLLLIQANDESRQDYLTQTMIRDSLFWLIAGAALLAFIGFLHHAEIRIPLRDLTLSISQNRKAGLDPEDFGDLADLVRAIEELRGGDDNASKDMVDAATGWPDESVSARMYEMAKKTREEQMVVFFHANFSRDYIHAFGRANRGVIKKMATAAIDAAMGKNCPKAITEDLYFVVVARPADIGTGFEKARKTFNEQILTLYELGQGRQVPIQTLSAVAVSTEYEETPNFSRALELVERIWPSIGDPKRGGYAVINAEGRIEGPDMAQPISVADVPAAARSAATPARPAKSDSAADTLEPALARKMFIVKLCRLGGIKPRLAAQVYSAGWHRPDLLLQTKIQELSAKAGIEAKEASDLIAAIRKLPKDKLAYDTDDYREVFVTDVRMIRKIPRESIARWFDAGYRRLEDLRNVKADDLIKLDSTIPKQDIEEVLTNIRASASR